MISSSKLQLIAVVLVVTVVTTKCQIELNITEPLHEDLFGVAKLGLQLADPPSPRGLQLADPTSPCYSKTTCGECAEDADCEFCGFYIITVPLTFGTCTKKGECANAKAGTYANRFIKDAFKLKAVDAAYCILFPFSFTHSVLEYETCEECKKNESLGWCQYTSKEDPIFTGGICYGSSVGFDSCKDDNTWETRLVNSKDKCSAGFRPVALFTLPLLFGTLASLF